VVVDDVVGGNVVGNVVVIVHDWVPPPRLQVEHAPSVGPDTLTSLHPPWLSQPLPHPGVVLPRVTAQLQPPVSAHSAQSEITVALSSCILMAAYIGSTQLKTTTKFTAMVVATIASIRQWEGFRIFSNQTHKLGENNCND